MEIVINIPDEMYDTFKRGIWSSTYDGKKIRDIVMNGTPLLKRTQKTSNKINRIWQENEDDWFKWYECKTCGYKLGLVCDYPKYKLPTKCPECNKEDN